jgi:hypothetical protein
MHQSACSACSFDLADADNFCRNCGAPVVAPAQLPAVASKTSVTIWKPQASPVVKGAAVMAAGTVGQFLVRRAVHALLRDGSKPKTRRAIRVRGGADDGMVDDAQIITETIMMRRVRIRRPA